MGGGEGAGTGLTHPRCGSGVHVVAGAHVSETPSPARSRGPRQEASLSAALIVLTATFLPLADSSRASQNLPGADPAVDPAVGLAAALGDPACGPGHELVWPAGAVESTSYLGQEVL